MTARKHAQPGDVLNGNTVIRFSHERVEARGRQKSYHYVFRCSCGKDFTANINYIRKGCTKGCGCARRNVHINFTHNMSGTPTYKAWTGMRDRCLNPNHGSYPDYGGRGITICARWLESFENFFADMGVKPVGLSLDRKDVHGHYCKDNCRWADPQTQRTNQRPRIRQRDQFLRMDADLAMILAH